MRRAHAVDQSQAGIVAALRAVGAEVFDFSHVGKGVPDLLACYRFRLYWFECKNPRTPAKRKRRLTDEEWLRSQLTDDELEFARRFPVAVVTTPQEALAVLGIKAA